MMIASKENMRGIVYNSGKICKFAPIKSLSTRDNSTLSCNLATLHVDAMN